MVAKREKILDDSPKVDEYMSKLNHPMKAEAEAVRAIILSVSPEISEGIKWNSPSFYYKGDMAVFNLHSEDALRVVFPNGVVIDDATGVLEGNYVDRRLAYFRSMDEVQTKKDALEAAIRGWMQVMDQ